MRNGAPLGAAIAACGLKQSRVVTVEVVARLAEPFDTCPGNFDGASDRIRLVDPDVMIEDTVYDLFPQEVVLRLLLAHALAYQASGGRIGIPGQEYIAATTEFRLMAPVRRDFLTEAAPVSGAPQDGMIDIRIYAMAPRKFAVDAWRLFRLPGNGCELIRRIIDAEGRLLEVGVAGSATLPDAKHRAPPAQSAWHEWVRMCREDAKRRKFAKPAKWAGRNPEHISLWREEIR